MNKPEDALGFVPIFSLPPGSIATAALVTCDLCGAQIRGMGGPMKNALCVPCTRAAIESSSEGGSVG